MVKKGGSFVFVELLFHVANRQKHADVRNGVVFKFRFSFLVGPFDEEVAPLPECSANSPFPALTITAEQNSGPHQRPGQPSIWSLPSALFSPFPLLLLLRLASHHEAIVHGGGHGIKVAYWRMTPEEALRRVKKEINEAPAVSDDPELYTLLFRNVSVFKRSYELMEKILKVYIYEDGPRPIFHTPELQGIYASEGWFMKLLEENKGFVTKDPSKAHLFYLPYSIRQLKLALYVPNSHNMRSLSLFLRDYVNTIAAKYPFWNRTRGRDHFLVACHDWGPYTTTLHEELCKNTIKAMCNADASEGIFVRGKDISLPETTIKVPKMPRKYVGGGHVSGRSILAFYAGNMHGRVRPLLNKYWGDDKDEDMRIYRRLPNRVSRTMSYVEHMRASKFCICPMGYEVNSPRIVEAIYAECIPVIIADNFVLPFEELLDWSAFSVVVAEKDILNLKNILLGISHRRYIRMYNCVRRLQKHFLWHAKPLKYDIFHMILHSIWFNRLNQIQQYQE
ncbi:hypothetical protein ZIOFF_048141 [Zingiber officinale]|uniref:Exostosin GT47 domain-containing protein n=1 Tax=Zingiber officinale TaxID=94328 RepID=A0A8J5FST4_ZINOF|nr:hypothetical protein ZIOFF_048141 [Zingiber officinale]